jgi:hypothetical protein
MYRYQPAFVSEESQIVDRDPLEVPRVDRGLAERRGGRRGDPHARPRGGDVGAGGLEAILGVEPVAVRAAGVSVVEDVEDGHLAALQDEPVAVEDVGDLEPGALALDGLRAARVADVQLPDGIGRRPDDLVEAARAGRGAGPAGCRTAREGESARGVGGARGVAHDRAGRDVNRDDLVPFHRVAVLRRRHDADIDQAPSVGIHRHGGHRFVQRERALADRVLELRVLADEGGGVLDLLDRARRLAGGRVPLELLPLRVEHQLERPLDLVVVDRRVEARVVGARPEGDDADVGEPMSGRGETGREALGDQLLARRVRLADGGHSNAPDGSVRARGQGRRHGARRHPGEELWSHNCA